MLVSDKKRLVAKLLSLFPDGDPGYFENCLAYYESDHVERIAEKIFSNGGVYPIILNGLSPCSTEQLNQALRFLATEIFPDYDVSYLREKVLGQSNSHIERVTEQVLLDRSAPERLESGRVERSDFLRNQLYKTQAEARLIDDFPQIWKSSIRAVLAENNWDYLNSYDQLAMMGSGGIWKSIRNFFMHWSLPRHRSTSATEPLIEKELAEEIDELHRRRLDLQKAADEKIAHKLNEDEYTICKQRITCQCCYDDFTFEDLCFCSQGEHAFCKECVGRFLSEGLFVQGNLRGSSRIACISSTDCGGCLPTRTLEHVLSPDLWKAYERSLFEENVKRQSWTLVQCASCTYCEVDESTKPLDTVTNKLLLWRNYIRWTITATIFTSVYYSTILFIILLSVQWTVVQQWDVHADLTTAYNRVVSARRGNIFRCGNLDCRKLTCLECMRPVRGYHKCWEKERDGLRLYVEKAMADAVKRTCPKCSISFQKSDGCNKIVCQCGYAMCYVCRKDIGKESYSHFCDHFRVVPGKSCGECTKCDLYKTDPEDESIRVAAAKARKQYLRAHPQVTEQMSHNTIVIGPLTALDMLDHWRREALLWLLQLGICSLV